MVIPYKILSLHTGDHSLQSGNTIHWTPRNPSRYLRNTTINMLTSFQIYTLAPMLPSRTPLLSYGTFTGSSQPSYPIGDTSFALNLETSSSVTGDSFVSALSPQFMHRDPSTSFLRIQYLTHFRPLRDQPVNADRQNVSSRMNTGTNLGVVTYVHAQLTYVYAQHLEGEM